MPQRYSWVEFAPSNSLVSTSERVTFGSLQTVVSAGVKIERQVIAIRVLLRASTEIGRNWCGNTASTTIMSEIPKFLTKSSIKTLSQKWQIICHFNLKKYGFSFVGKLINGNIFLKCQLTGFCLNLNSSYIIPSKTMHLLASHREVSERLSSRLVQRTMWCRRILHLALLAPQNTCPSMLLLFWSVWGLTWVFIPATNNPELEWSFIRRHHLSLSY